MSACRHQQQTLGEGDRTPDPPEFTNGPAEDTLLKSSQGDVLHTVGECMHECVTAQRQPTFSPRGNIALLDPRSLAADQLNLAHLWTRYISDYSGVNMIHPCPQWLP